MRVRHTRPGAQRWLIWRVGFACWVAFASRSAAAMTYSVPGDFATIQAALNAAVGGDTINVASGTYSEKITFPHSGSAGGGYITLQAGAAQTPVLDGTGVPGSNMVLIDTKSYVKVIGFEIRNNLNVSDGSGVRIIGSGSHIEIRNNNIRDIRGRDAMGVTVYGTAATSISDLIIDGNQIHDCEPARSEALTLNGNVEMFQVTNNVVHDVNNIGIDFIGGETDIQPDTSKVARNGICSGNQVTRARSIYGGGFAGGIYVDGGKDITIEGNRVTESDLGIEIGAENAGIIASGVVVRDNLVYHNDKAGIVFGGFDASVGRVQNCSFLNNTTYQNDTLGEGLGELWIQFASDNTIRNNIFYSTAQNILLYSENGNLNNALDYNLWFTDAGSASAIWVWRSTEYDGFTAYQSGSGQDTHSVFSNPQFVDATMANFHLVSASPAVNAGDPAFVAGVGELDIDGAPRVSGGRVDIGADEASCGDGIIDPGEVCDDGDLIDCNGCDSNCTPSSTCGNGIRCGPEQCDDGNTVNGDCCSATCSYEAAASPCDDHDLCTILDQCDGSGVCAGTAAPEPVCRQSAPAKSSILMKDKTPDGGDQISWRWTKGAQTSAMDLGDPLNGTTYALCVYDQSVRLQPLLRENLLPGGVCDGKPCWTTTSAGVHYRNATGIRSLKLKAGDPGKAQASLRGKGAALALPSLGLTPTVTVQVKNSNGQCWGASFSNPTANSSEQFKAKSD